MFNGEENGTVTMKLQQQDSLSGQKQTLFVDPQEKTPPNELLKNNDQL